MSAETKDPIEVTPEEASLLGDAHNRMMRAAIDLGFERDRSVRTEEALRAALREASSAYDHLLAAIAKQKLPPGERRYEYSHDLGGFVAKESEP